jgi:hypothetical protein
MAEVVDDSWRKVIAYLFITVVAMCYFAKITFFSKYTKKDLNDRYQTVMIGLFAGFFVVYRLFSTFF